MPKSETSVDFVYPTSNIPNECQEYIEEFANDVVKQKLNGVINRMFFILSGEKRPDILLSAMMFDAGLVPTSSSKADMARGWNMSRQAYNYYCGKWQLIVKEIGEC
jgi:hypothetical protein